MKHLLLATLVLSALSCSADNDIKYHRVRTEVQVPDVNHDTGGDLQYMAYCSDEERALSDWVSRSEAESAASSYRSEHPDRATTILWRQKPGGRLIPKHPRG